MSSCLLTNSSVLSPGSYFFLSSIVLLFLFGLSVTASYTQDGQWDMTKGSRLAFTGKSLGLVCQHQYIWLSLSSIYKKSNLLWFRVPRHWNSLPICQKSFTFQFHLQTYLFPYSVPTHNQTPLPTPPKSTPTQAHGHTLMYLYTLTHTADCGTRIWDPRGIPVNIAYPTFRLMEQMNDSLHGYQSG